MGLGLVAIRPNPINPFITDEILTDIVIVGHTVTDAVSVSVVVFGEKVLCMNDAATYISC